MCSIIARRRHSWRAAGCATGHVWRCFHAIHRHKPSGRGAVIPMMEMCQERTICYLSALFLAAFTIHCCCCSRNGQHLSKADFKSHPKADFSLTCILMSDMQTSAFCLQNSVHMTKAQDSVSIQPQNLLFQYKIIRSSAPHGLNFLLW